MTIAQRLDDLGIVLPGQLQLPPGVAVPFRWVRLHGDRAFVSGHGPLTPDGTPAGPYETGGCRRQTPSPVDSLALARPGVLAALSRG